MRWRTVVVVLSSALACGDGQSFDGAWSGGSAQYPQVRLILTQQGDSLHGSGLATRSSAPGTEISSTLIGSWHGDTVYVRGVALPPSVGGGFAMQFGGRLTAFSNLVGTFVVANEPPSGMLLERVGDAP